MVVHLGRELEAALIESAKRRGIAPETLALEALRERFLVTSPGIEPRDDWERRVLGAATDCGISLSDAAVSSDGLYE